MRALSLEEARMFRNALEENGQQGMAGIIGKAIAEGTTIMVAEKNDKFIQEGRDDQEDGA